MMARCDGTKDIAVLERNGNTASSGKKNDSDGVGYSQSGTGQLQDSGKGMKILVMLTECQGNWPMLMD